ncbi:hypothetical protein A2617_00105 [Candidatus Daviesbacteria bacterium RIFOXYD1_FULL_41_10]|uniref:Uncharacterized protein n=2 Tax=Candidatus Daviesiibacteriota TaxID=1752718 RepID=A0A1F5N145_9BACT|nr:MAG: hypothetical protein UU67_C0026G0012 [Candidatus Daviesbacteria bacterium GW2011_GWB1_41_5]OGE71331.1 MAG: hypothetical protein A2617_00105 [Candidatus Daviesbacteria bacterium RIFOXYD1_FULL_41_10]
MTTEGNLDDPRQRLQAFQILNDVFEKFHQNPKGDPAALMETSLTALTEKLGIAEDRAIALATLYAMSLKAARREGGIISLPDFNSVADQRTIGYSGFTWAYVDFRIGTAGWTMDGLLHRTHFETGNNDPDSIRLLKWCDQHPCRVNDFFIESFAKPTLHWTHRQMIIKFNSKVDDGSLRPLEFPEEK